MQLMKKLPKNVVRDETDIGPVYIKIPFTKKNVLTKKGIMNEGSYIFFSESETELERVAVDELANNGFYFAIITENEEGTGYVLKLSDINDSRKRELAQKYKDNSKVKYKCWSWLFPRSGTGTASKNKIPKNILDKLI